MPNLHPILIHFPIALLTTSFLFDLLGFITRKPEFLRAGWWVLIVGIAGLVVTIISGLLAEKSITIPASAVEHFQKHQQICFLVSGLYSVLFLWRVANRGALPKDREKFFLFLGCIGVAAIWVGAWYGGELVFGYGVGVTMP